jgi:alanine dehydrogenase
LPYLLRVATNGVVGAATADPALRAGLSTLAGALVSPAVAEAHGMPLRDPAELLGG